MFLKQTFHQSYHHDCCCHIIEDGREIEGDKADYPEQAREFGCLNARGDDLKTAVGVGHLNNSHCAYQEEYNSCCFSQFFRELVADAFHAQRACK